MGWVSLGGLSWVGLGRGWVEWVELSLNWVGLPGAHADITLNLYLTKGNTTLTQVTQDKQ